MSTLTRLRAAARTISTWGLALGVSASYAAYPAPAANPPPPLVLEQNDPAVGYPNGSWAPDYSPNYSAGVAMYSVDNNATSQFTIPPPPAGYDAYTRCQLKGYRNANVSGFDVYVNGVKVYEDNQFSVVAGQATYFNVAATTGDVVQVVFTKAGTNNYGLGGSNALLIDYFYLT